MARRPDRTEWRSETWPSGMRTRVVGLSYVSLGTWSVVPPPAVYAVSGSDCRARWLRRHTVRVALVLSWCRAAAAAGKYGQAYRRLAMPRSAL